MVNYVRLECQNSSNSFLFSFRAKLTKNQVEFLTKQCPKAEITPTLQNAICNLKKLGLSDVKVADVLKLDVNDVRSVKC